MGLVYLENSSIFALVLTKNTDYENRNTPRILPFGSFQRYVERARFLRKEHL